MARALSFFIRYFSNYYTLHRSDLAARAAPLDPRLKIMFIKESCLSQKYIIFESYIDSFRWKTERSKVEKQSFSSLLD